MDENTNNPDVAPDEVAPEEQSAPAEETTDIATPTEAPDAVPPVEETVAEPAPVVAEVDSTESTDVTPLYAATASVEESTASRDYLIQ